MTKRSFQSKWQCYEPMVKAIVELFHPFVEAAVHDLERGVIVALYHNISQRKVGDASPLQELKVDVRDFPDYFDPYYKQNWDGRALKCTSITIRDDRGKPVGLICFNVDTSMMQDAFDALGAFLKTKSEAQNPVEAYGAPGQEQVTAMIQQYLKEANLSLTHLNRSQKQELVIYLYRKGIFNFKNVAPYIAKCLNISRASVYNYLKQISE